METGLYVAISGQMALQKRMDTIANNVANANTTGFRAEKVRFESLVSQAQADPVAFASTGNTYLSKEAGALTRTGNLLDVAVQGDGWFSVATQNGPGYTRDGRMQVNANGELLSVTGERFLDIGGAPIVVNPRGGPIEIARDGMISQGGRQVSAIGLFRIAPEANLSRLENSVIQSDVRPQPVLDFTENGVVQGYVEGSNVNAIQEITSLISVTRAFENITTAIGRADDILGQAIQEIGDPR